MISHLPSSTLFPYTTLFRSNQIVPIKNGDWRERTKWLEPHIVPGFTALEQRRQATGHTLGVLRVSKIRELRIDRKSTRLNSSHVRISYAVFCLKKKNRYNIFDADALTRSVSPTSESRL